MSWNLDGLTIGATYLEDYLVTGRVESSRVAYGGRVLHTVRLARAINVFGADRDTVILDERELDKSTV